MEMQMISILILSVVIAFQGWGFLVLNRKFNDTYHELCEEKFLSKMKLEIERSNRQIERSLYDDKINEAIARNIELIKNNESCKEEKLRLEMEMQRLKEGK